MYKVCARCCMDISDPDISFDENGICNHCYEYEKKEKQRQKDKFSFPWILDDIRKKGKGKKYDCLIGLSGGVDSSLTLHWAVENGLRPFTYQVDNGWNTKESDENVMKLVEGMKVPFYRYTIDVEAFKGLQRDFIESCTPNIEIPTDHILMATTYEMASQYGIKYVLSGGNIATEGIMPPSWGYNARDLRFIKAVSKHSLKGIPKCSWLKWNYYRWIKKIKIVYPLDYIEYNRENAKKLLSENYGWKDYGEKHCESVFTQWFQHYYLPTFFGIDKRLPHYSSLINSGQMTRDEAMKKFQEPISYKNILEVSFRGLFKKKSHKDYKNSERLWNVSARAVNICKYLMTSPHR